MLVGSVAVGHPHRVAVVIVDADDVGRHALPAIVTNHRPRRVERLGEVVQRLDVMPLGRTVGQVGHAPRFIERHPGDDHGWLHRARAPPSTRAVKRSMDSSRKAIALGISSHTSRPSDVGPIEKSRTLDLLMLTHSVEAHRLGQFDIAANRLIVGRRQTGLWPITLIQHHAQRIRAAVQNEPVSLNRDRAQRGITARRNRPRRLGDRSD